MAACANSQRDDKVNFHYPTALRTQISFEPLSREQAERYLEGEKLTYKTNTAPMVERKAGLDRGREQRYHEIRSEFPECQREKHCMQHISRDDIAHFERFVELTKEINAYDAELINLDTALRDWKNRLELRTRAILNRFLVHELLQLPSIEPRFQGVLAYSLESFEARRQLGVHLMRYEPEVDLEPRLLGDYDFRMLGRPIDEAAVIATIEVYLMPSLAAPTQPTRYVVALLVNTHQLDMRYYDKDFLRSWAAKLADPFQNGLRDEAYCGLYSIAGDTLAPRFDTMRPKRCAERRSYMRSLDAGQFPDRFAPDQWLLPIAYFPMPKP